LEQGDNQMFVERAERRPVRLAGFALSATRDCDIEIADISYSGCKLASDDAFEAGEVVELRILKRGASQAEIRWCSDGRAGALFIA